MIRGRLIAFLCVAFAVCLGTSLSIFGQGSSYSGRATGVVSISPTAGTAGDSCPLPAAGGTVTLNTPSSTLPGIATGTINSTTSGGGTSSQSTVTVNNLNMNAGGYNISATSVYATTQCTCCPGSAEPTCTGNTSITNLVVTGPSGPIPITITGAPNQVVNVPGGTITINEQIRTPNEINVNAIHVNITSGGVTTNAIIGSVHSDIVCGTGNPSPTEVRVAGRVQTSGGQPISNASVTLISQNGTRKSAVTSALGAFSIEGITAGQSYGLETTHKTYTFAPRVINVVDEINDLVITPQ